MKNKTQQKTNTISVIFVLILGGLVTLALLLLRHLNILHLDYEIALAPFIVISLLTFGDKLIIFIFLSPISYASKLLSKTRDSQQQQLNLK
jgi:hypothetical protein